MKGLTREYNANPNTLGLHIINDDKTADNYMALCKCIVGVKSKDKVRYPSTSQACSAYKLYQDYDPLVDSKNTKQVLSYETKTKEIKRHTKKLRLIVENTITGEKTECNGVESVNKLIGIKTTNVSTYICTGIKYKGIYIIHRVGKKGDNSRSMKLTNIKTNEVKEFNSLKDVANFLERATSTVKYHINKKSSILGYKIEYMD